MTNDAPCPTSADLGGPVPPPGPCSPPAAVDEERITAVRAQLVQRSTVVIPPARFDAVVVGVTANRPAVRVSRVLTSVSVLQVRLGAAEAALRRWACRPAAQSGGATVPVADWSDAEPQIVALLAELPVVVHQGWPERLLLLHHLPSWQPGTVIAVRRLARHHGPGIGSRSLVEAWQALRPSCRLTCGPELAWCHADRAVLTYALLDHLTRAGLTWAAAQTAGALPVAALVPPYQPWHQPRH
jgi:hypothetical protein